VPLSSKLPSNSQAAAAWKGLADVTVPETLAKPASPAWLPGLVCATACCIARTTAQTITSIAIVAAWNGSTSNPTTNANTTWLKSAGLKNVWTQLSNLAGNATATNVTLFLDSRRTSSSQDLTAFWDDVLAYRAFVPPAPTVTANTSTSLNVNVQPGCNSGNSSAEYAISIGGGAYTLGTHWVQANGTVSTTTVWQTDATWGAKTVTGSARASAAARIALWNARISCLLLLVSGPAVSAPARDRR